MAETIENNVRKLILDESPVNPKYYEQMSKLLDALIEQRRQEGPARDGERREPLLPRGATGSRSS